MYQASLRRCLALGEQVGSRLSSPNMIDMVPGSKCSFCRIISQNSGSQRKGRSLWTTFPFFFLSVAKHSCRTRVLRAPLPLISRSVAFIAYTQFFREVSKKRSVYVCVSVCMFLYFRTFRFFCPDCCGQRTMDDAGGSGRVSSHRHKAVQTYEVEDSTVVRDRRFTRVTGPV